MIASTYFIKAVPRLLALLLLVTPPPGVRGLFFLPGGQLVVHDVLTIPLAVPRPGWPPHGMMYPTFSRPHHQQQYPSHAPQAPPPPGPLHDADTVLHQIYAYSTNTGTQRAPAASQRPPRPPPRPPYGRRRLQY